MLSPPEAFLATMSTVPRLMDKINLLILIQQFEVLACALTALRMLFHIMCVPEKNVWEWAAVA